MGKIYIVILDMIGNFHYIALMKKNRRILTKRSENCIIERNGEFRNNFQG